MFPMQSSRLDLKIPAIEVETTKLLSSGGTESLVFPVVIPVRGRATMLDVIMVEK